MTDEPPTSYSSLGPFDAVLNGKNITITTRNTLLKALDLPYKSNSVIVRTKDNMVSEDDWNVTNLNKLTITRESDGHGVTFTLGYTDGSDKITIFDNSYASTNGMILIKCARYDLGTAVEHGCTLNDLIKSANNGDKLKLTFTSN